MVKQSTHNRLSVSSILTWPTTLKYPFYTGIFLTNNIHFNSSQIYCKYIRAQIVAYNMKYDKTTKILFNRNSYATTLSGRTDIGFFL